MPAMLWDTASSAFKEAETPKVWNGTEFTDSVGMVNVGSGWTEGWSGGSDPIVVGETYSFGGYEWIAAEDFGDYVTLQSKGVTGGAWPGYKMSKWGNGSTYQTNIDGQDISEYNSITSILYSSISSTEYTSASYGSGLFLVSNSKAGTTSSDSQGSGNYWSALLIAASNYSSLGASYNRAWLGTFGYNERSWFVSSDMYVGATGLQGTGYTVAPAFNLDLSKVEITGTTITAK